MFSSCYHMGTLFDLRCLYGTPFLLIHHVYPRTCLKYLSVQNQQLLTGSIVHTGFFPPVIEGFSQIAPIYLASVSCLPLFRSLPADIDECQVHNGGCQHRCVNTRGSYYCECHLGSRLHVDGRTCLGEEVILRRFLICGVSFCQKLLVCIWTNTSTQKHTQSWPKRELQLRTPMLLFTITLLCLILLRSALWGGQSIIFSVPGSLCCW